MQASVARRTVLKPSPIGTRLQAILQGRRCSLSELSTRSGVSVSQLSLLTRGGITYPRVSTLQAICRALEISESLLLDQDEPQARRSADLKACEGVTVVPVVQLVVGGGFVETGQTCAVASAHLLAGRNRLFVALVDGGGMAPHVLTGDRILFDPDEAPTDDVMVLVRHGSATITAWRVVEAKTACYVLGDGSQLDAGAVTLAGTVVYIMRSPPAFRRP